MRRNLGLTFAGGGNRAFYQLGLMSEWGPELWPRVGVVAACSAGAAAATFLLSGRMDETERFFAEQRRGVRGLFSMQRLRSGKRPFPHNEIYRATLRHSLIDGGLEAIREQPFPILFICSAFPERLPKVVGIFLGVAAYQAEKTLVEGLLHPRLPRKVGFVPRVFDARDCNTIDELVELIISSSSTPPFLDLGRFDGALVDGSLIDNAPAFVADDVEGIQDNLVLLTRPYREEQIGRKGSRYYIAPAEKLPVDRWDYSEHAPVEATFEIGQRDATRHRAALDAVLA